MYNETTLAMAAPELALTKAGRPAVTCRACDSAAYDCFLEGHGYRIVTCRNCGLRYVNPQPTDQELHDFYSNFDQETTWRGDGEEPFDRAMRKIILRHRKPGSVLDVGSSRGNFLLSMRAAGFDVFGVEPSATNSEFARTQNKIHTYTGTVEDFLSSPFGGPFDVITLLNVIEHLREPKAVLCGLRELLMDDGIVALVVPDARFHAALGKVRSLLGFSDPYWMAEGKRQLVGFDPPQHLCSFEPRTIKQLVESCGFSTIALQSAPVILNRVALRDLAKASVRFASDLLRILSFGHLVVGYSTAIIARRVSR